MLQQNGPRVIARAGCDGVRRFDARAANHVDHRDTRKLGAHGHPAFGA
jgi:hypothetical protein